MRVLFPSTSVSPLAGMGKNNPSITASDAFYETKIPPSVSHLEISNDLRAALRRSGRLLGKPYDVLQLQRAANDSLLPASRPPSEGRNEPHLSFSGVAPSN